MPRTHGGNCTNRQGDESASGSFFQLGFGAGSFSLAAPIYIVECSEPRIRGSLAILMQFMVTSGNVFTNGFGSFMEWEYLTYIILGFPGEETEKVC